MGNRDQFFTTCKRCRRQILMTYCYETGKWVPCDPTLKHFDVSGGPVTYITINGDIKHGNVVPDGPETGYRKHRRDCV